MSSQNECKPFFFNHIQSPFNIDVIVMNTLKIDTKSLSLNCEPLNIQMNYYKQYNGNK